jgi:hypothetical protein
MTDPVHVPKNPQVQPSRRPPLLTKLPHIFLWSTLILHGDGLIDEKTDLNAWLLDEDVSTMVEDFILERVVPCEKSRSFASKLQKIANYISFVHEMADPLKTKAVINNIPELAIIQVYHLGSVPL